MRGRFHIEVHRLSLDQVRRYIGSPTPGDAAKHWFEIHVTDLTSEKCIVGHRIDRSEDDARSWALGLVHNDRLIKLANSNASGRAIIKPQQVQVSA